MRTSDGLLRAAPLIARYEGGVAPAGYYESLGLAVYRLAAGVTCHRAGLRPGSAGPARRQLAKR